MWGVDQESVEMSKAETKSKKQSDEAWWKREKVEKQVLVEASRYTKIEK